MSDELEWVWPPPLLVQFWKPSEAPSEFRVPATERGGGCQPAQLIPNGWLTKDSDCELFSRCPRGGDQEPGVPAFTSRHTTLLRSQASLWPCTCITSLALTLLCREGHPEAPPRVPPLLGTLLAGRGMCEPLRSTGSAQAGQKCSPPQRRMPLRSV